MYLCSNRKFKVSRRGLDEMHFCVLYFWYDIMMLMELNSKCTEGIIMSVGYSHMNLC